MAIFKAIDSSSKKIGGAKGILGYVGKKAEETIGINCSNDYKEAFRDFQDIKEFYNKLEDRQYKHFVHSFKPNEIERERALEMTQKLCEEIFPEYQVFIAQHTDKEHIHNHIVVNSVNLENGEKFYYAKKEWEKWRERADEIAQEYGLEKVQEREKENGEIIARNMKARKVLEKALVGQIESDILKASLLIMASRESCNSRKEFENNLKENGISIDWGETIKDDGTIKYKKYITCTLDEDNRIGNIGKYRLDTLGKHINSEYLKTENLREYFIELEKKEEKNLEETREEKIEPNQNNQGLEIFKQFVDLKSKKKKKEEKEKELMELEEEKKEISNINKIDKKLEEKEKINSIKENRIRSRKRTRGIER